MTQRARDGRNASKQQTPEDNAPPPQSPEPASEPAPSPLAFAIRVMEDEEQPMALRVTAAKLAASLLPKGGAGEPPDGEPAAVAEPLSDLEKARRIAHILAERHYELRKKELIAQGWDVEKRGMPLDNSPWAAFLARIRDSL